VLVLTMSVSGSAAHGFAVFHHSFRDVPLRRPEVWCATANRLQRGDQPKRGFKAGSVQHQGGGLASEGLYL
jgi:hypothetical protein